MISLFPLRRVSFKSHISSVSVEHVTAGYTAHCNVLNDFNGTFVPGVNVVLGKNGSGKTTLAKVLAGLLPTVSGQLLVDGCVYSERDVTQRALFSAYVSQQPDAGWPFLVRDVVAEGRFAYRGTELQNEDNTAVAKAISVCGIEHLVNRRITDLSGGERQLVFLARAVCQQTPLLILDEPFSAMDPAHVSVCSGLLRRLGDSGTLVVAVLHDVITAQRIADRVLLVDNGKNVAEGDVANVMTVDTLSRVFGTSFGIFAGNGGEIVIPIVGV